MRIGLCAREYAPSVDRGGIGAHIYHLARGLREVGHDVAILAEADVVGHRDGRTESGAGGPARRTLLPRAAVGTLRYSLALARAVRRAGARLDVVEAPDWRAEGLGLALAKPAPLVVKLHTPHFVIQRYDSSVSALDRLIINALEKRAVIGADLILSPSQSLAEIVARQYRLPPARIHIVRYPIDVNVFAPATQDSTSGPRVVLFAGRLNRRKGAHILAEAIPHVLRACPGTVFLIVSPESATSPAAVTLLGQENAAERVRFLPPQPREAMVGVYQASDVCVVPSLYDNLPYASLEAMACGKPVVASAVGGLAEVIQPDVTGVLVPPGNAAALAEAVIALLNDAPRRRELGRNARAYVEDNLSGPHIAAETVQHYQQIQRNGYPPRHA